MELREILTQHYRVSQKAIEAFASACELVSCEPMVKVVEQGRVADSLWITRQGVARIVFEGDEGESTVAFGSDGDVFTSVHSFHCGQPSKFSLETLVKTDFYRIGFTDLKRLLHEYENLLMCGLSAYALMNSTVWKCATAASAPATHIHATAL